MLSARPAQPPPLSGQESLSLETTELHARGGPRVCAHRRRDRRRRQCQKYRNCELRTEHCFRTVGKSKTTAGTGRIIPLNPRALAVLSHWRSLFPGTEPEHYVFPHEKYGLAGNERKQCAYEIIRTEPMHRWKVAWETARSAAKVSCRFHDLRHTFISRLAESQASDSTVMALAGHVSRAMMERYSHIRMEAKRRAVDDLSGTRCGRQPLGPSEVSAEVVRFLRECTTTSGSQIHGSEA